MWKEVGVRGNMSSSEDKLYLNINKALYDKRELSKDLIRYLNSFDNKSKKRLKVGLLIETIERINSKDNRIRKLIEHKKPKQIPALFKPINRLKTDDS